MAASPFSTPLHGKAQNPEQFHQPVPVLQQIVGDQDSGNFLSGSDPNDAARSTQPDGHSRVTAFDRDLELKYGTCAGTAGHRDIAPHQASVCAANGEPQAGSLFSVKITVGLVKRLEQLLLFVIRNARTGVLNAG